MSDLARKLAGRFVVIDGPDGAGKSTQVDLLAGWLRDSGAAVTQVRDPGGTAIGDRIREILLDNEHEEMAVECETMLYMASRAQLVAEIVRPALARGDCVLSDRYIFSTIAYQGAGGADPEQIRAAGEIATGGLWPDLTIILDVSAHRGLARLTGEPDRMEAKGHQFHTRVRKFFQQLPNEDPRRFVLIDDGGTVDEVHQQLREKIINWRFD